MQAISQISAPSHLTAKLELNQYRCWCKHSVDVHRNDIDTSCVTKGCICKKFISKLKVQPHKPQRRLSRHQIEKKMKKLLDFKYIAIIFLFLGLSLFHSSSATAQVVFQQANVTSAVQAQAFEYRVYVTPAGTTTQNPGIVLPAVVCSGFAAGMANCTAPTPATLSAALVTGAKSVITAKDLTAGIAAVESAQSTPFFSGAAPPTTLSIK